MDSLGYLEESHFLREAFCSEPIIQIAAFKFGLSFLDLGFQVPDINLPWPGTAGYLNLYRKFPDLKGRRHQLPTP